MQAIHHWLSDLMEWALARAVNVGMDPNDSEDVRPQNLRWSWAPSCLFLRKHGSMAGALSKKQVTG